MKKAQMSMEYLLLTGFILLAIIVPSMIFMHSFFGQSVYGTLNSQRINDLGRGLTKSAKEIYFLGLYSKQVVEYEIPDNLEKMFILDFNESNEHIYYIVIFSQDRKGTNKFYFLSDVPLTSDDSSNYVEHIESDVPVDFRDEIDECIGNKKCSFYNFIDNAIFPGKKSYRIETIYSQNKNEISVSIIPIID
jgi:hypothetical protein